MVVSTSSKPGWKPGYLSQVIAAMAVRCAPDELPATKIVSGVMPYASPWVRAHAMTRFASIRCSGNPSAGVSLRW